MTEEYGFIHAINLLGSKENETVLSNAYEKALKNSHDLYPDHVGMTQFDFHAAVKISGHEYVVRELRLVNSTIIYAPDMLAKPVADVRNRSQIISTSLGSRWQTRTPMS